jgi:DNA adenine methylase Dam
LLEFLANNTTEDSLDYINSLIKKYKLTIDNKDGYLKLRDYYNKENRHPIILFTLISFAFNSQIRFNKKGEYNIAFGMNRSYFNETQKENFIKFCNELHKQNIAFDNKSFEEFNFDELENDTFIYCDPPYLGSVATYNERDGWTEQSEEQLLDLLDDLDNKGFRWALSNNLKYENELLKEWKDKYNVHDINVNYNNCSYHKKTTNKTKDMEVLITNY